MKSSAWPLPFAALCAALFCALLDAPVAAAQDSGVSIRTFPARPIIERDAHQQLLNFDFGLTNSTSDPREIVRITVSVFDAEGRLVDRRFVWAKGAASPALLTVPERTIPAHGMLSVFNPFVSFAPHVPLTRLRFDFTFDEVALEPRLEASIDVVPREMPAPMSIRLPVDGPAIVYDGHDFYSHHRRIPLGSELARKVGLTSNPVRYANDLVPLGPRGELARGPLSEPQNWHAYGAVVRAPAAGVVVSVANDVPENRIAGGNLVVPPDATSDRLRAALGNHVIIRHEDSVFTTLAHLRSGSVRVAVGDSVRTGAPVGEIGFSGDTGFHVHLHHMMSTSATLDAEGIPIYVDHVRRVRLPKRGAPGPVLRGLRLDTGDIVEAVF